MSTPVQQSRFRPFSALHVSGALLLAATSGCALEIEDAALDPSWTDGLEDVDLSPIAPAGDQWNSCPTWDCGKNHPMLTGFPVPEVHEGGLPDDNGLSLESFQQGFQTLRLDVDRGEIKGYDSGGALVLDGASAVGTIFTIGNGATTWRVRIDDYARIPYWTGADDATVPGYRLLYQKVGGLPTVWFNVCNEPADVTLDPEWQGGYETYALLISDERYDRDAKRVRGDVSAEDWFNIACAGTALAKMVLLRFDPHIPLGDTYYTTKARRTITLKMLTADYLGFGEAFTQGGIELHWRDSQGWHLSPLPAPSEAVWDEHGAVCLDTPRLEGIEFDMLGQIQEVCDETPGCVMPPSCSALGVTPFNWTLYGSWRTWNP